MNTIDIIDVNGCVVKDESGKALAELTVTGRGKVQINRLPACDLGSYFYILIYLRELGYEPVE